MADWELEEITASTCDECLKISVCNIYRQRWGCNCLKCQSIERIYRFKTICGSCLGKWLKSSDIDDA